MKLSCIPLNFGRQILRERTMSNEDWIKMAVELGMDGTEIYEGFISSLDASGMSGLADVIYDAGLQVSQFTTESDFSNPEKREQAITHVTNQLILALITQRSKVQILPPQPYVNPSAVRV